MAWNSILGITYIVHELGHSMAIFNCFHCRRSGINLYLLNLGFFSNRFLCVFRANIWQQSASHACEWGFCNPILMQWQITMVDFWHVLLNDNEDVTHHSKICGSASDLSQNSMSDFNPLCGHSLWFPYDFLHLLFGCPMKILGMGRGAHIVFETESHRSQSSVAKVGFS